MRSPRARSNIALFRRRLAANKPGCVRPVLASTGIHSLVVLDDAQALRACLMEGANPNEVDATGCTPLHVALVLDHLASLRVLLSLGAHLETLVGEPSSGPVSWLRYLKAGPASTCCHFAKGDAPAVLVRSEGALACLKAASLSSFPHQALWEALMRRPDRQGVRLPLLTALREEGVEMAVSLDALASHQKHWMHLALEEDLLAQARALLQWGVLPTAHTLALAVAPQGQDALDVEERSLDLFKLLLEQESVQLWSMSSEAAPTVEALLRQKFLMPQTTQPWLAAYQQSRQDRLNRSWPCVAQAPEQERF